MSVHFGMATQYIVDLKKNVMRWVQSKLAKWSCVTNAPIWYINNKETNEYDVDPVKSEYVKMVFKMRAKQESFSAIANELYKKWLTSRTWKKLVKASIERMIKNPFYVWMMKFSWKLYPWKHKQFISKDLWDIVNSEKRGYKKHNAWVEFKLKWIVKNWHTKKPLLALWKKQKYVYYSTHSTEEKIINMNESHIIEAFDKHIDKYVIPKALKLYLIEWLKEYYKDLNSELQKKYNALKRSIEEIEKKKDRLFNLICNETISEDKYKEEVNNLELQKRWIEEELKDLNYSDSIILQEVFEIVELLVKLKDKRKNGDRDTKLEIIKLIVVELFVDTKKQLYVQENELFEIIKVSCSYVWQGPLELHLRLSGSESEYSSS